MPAHPVSRLVRFTLAVGTNVIFDHLAIGGLQPTPCAWSRPSSWLPATSSTSPTATIRASPWRWCASVWARLREHPPWLLSVVWAAAKVAAADVYRIAKAWQWQTTATRLRALR